MKKIFLTLLLLLSFISFTSAGTWSYDNSYSYGDAYAYAKVTGMYPECEGTAHGIYCVGRWYADLSFTGDKFYISYRPTVWASADDEGYSGGGVQSVSNGRVYLDENGLVPYYVIYAWDYDSISSGDWAWTSQGGGYLGDKYFNKKNIECYDNSECSSDKYCNKEGEWDDWSCQIKECDMGQTKCVGYDYYSCKDYKWVNDGKVLNKCNIECFSDSNCPVNEKIDEFCRDKNTIFDIKDYYCSNYNCLKRIIQEDKGKILNNCGVECLSDSDCSEDSFIGSKFCVDNNITQKFVDYSCHSNECNFIEEERALVICDENCEEGTCTEWTFFEKNKTLIIFGGIALIFIFAVVFIFKKRKR